MPWYTSTRTEPMEVAVRYQVTMKRRSGDSTDGEHHLIYIQQINRSVLEVNIQL